MNRFVTRSKPANNKINFTQKRPASSNNEVANNENASENLPSSFDRSSKQVEEASLMARLQSAIRNNDAQFTFDTLSKNRPFDNAMNKTMTKMEFSSSYSHPTSEYMLLSVDESVVDAFKEGQGVAIRGESTDDAVLCTQNTTFPMKIIESATTVLLLHTSLDAPDSPTVPTFEFESVNGKCYSTGELCPAVDNLNVGRLKDMLREQELQWNWKEKKQLKGYDLRDLLDCVQMSVGELKTALMDLPVVRFPNGKYHYLSHKFRGEMLGMIVEALDDDSVENVKLELVSFEGLRQALPENVPDQVIEWFLDSKCEKILDDSSGYRLSEATLIRDLTVVILYGVGKMPYQQFRDLLTRILPFGVAVNEKIFEGIADIADGSFGKVITYLGPEDLPDTIKDRLIYLFDYRKLWSMEQLRPYFNDVYKSKVSFDKYVVQNCEYSLSDTNEMMYCGVR